MSFFNSLFQDVFYYNIYFLEYFFLKFQFYFGLNFKANGIGTSHGC